MACTVLVVSITRCVRQLADTSNLTCVIALVRRMIIQFYYIFYTFFQFFHLSQMVRTHENRVSCHPVITGLLENRTAPESWK